MRCNNDNDLLHFNFPLEISIFSEAWYISQSKIYDGACIAKI